MNISTNQSRYKNVVLLSPFIIILINCIVAIFFGKLIGKWSFIPIILIEWCLFMYFVLTYGGVTSIKAWLRKPNKSYGWIIFSILIGMGTIPIFLLHNSLLTDWTIWLP